MSSNATGERRKIELIGRRTLPKERTSKRNQIEESRGEGHTDSQLRGMASAGAADVRLLRAWSVAGKAGGIVYKKGKKDVCLSRKGIFNRTYTLGCVAAVRRNMGGGGGVTR